MEDIGNLPEQSGENKLRELRESPERTTLSRAFKEKPCKFCGEIYRPLSPSNLYCSPECIEAGLDDGYYRRTYGIGKITFDAMWDSQGGVCALCGDIGFLMREHHRKRLVIDHCHRTGKVRGLLCHNCNRALGLFKDNPEVLLRAACYVLLEGRCNDYPHGEYGQAAGSAQPRVSG